MSEAPFFLSCEHATNAVPAPYRFLFRKDRKILSTHRGYDIGAAELAGFLGQRFEAPLYLGTVSRLIVDLNRTKASRNLFSAFSGSLSEGERREIYLRYHVPYHHAVEVEARRQLKKSGRVFHLSVHSFTPVLKDEVRNAELGILYDPARKKEKRLASAWREILSDVLPGLRVRFNYPYPGIMDGMVTSLRRRIRSPQYTGIELEVNQKLVSGKAAWRKIQEGIALSLGRLLPLLEKI